MECPIRKFCKACKQGIQELIPRKQNKKLGIKNVCVAIIEDHHRFFIQQRASQGLLADLWEFPGGEKKKGESILAALKRTIQKDLNVVVQHAKLFLKTKHFYTKFCIHLYAFKCTVDLVPKSSRTRKWITLQAFERYPMSSGMCKIVERLKVKT